MVNLSRIAGLDYLASVHHYDAVGVARHHSEVVRDDDHRRPELRGQILHQFKNLRLNCHIQCGGWFVSNDEARIATESHRDHHTLPHTTTELVRVVLQPALSVRDADELQELSGACLRLLL